MDPQSRKFKIFLLVLCFFPKYVVWFVGLFPRPRQAAAAVAGGDGAREARTGPKRPLHSRAAAKMSPRIRIGPEPVLADHDPSPPAAGSHCPAREDSAPHCGTEFKDVTAGVLG